jgi:hypothetical protein
MNQQPEKLFRERLENYQRPVSAEAWSRVESRLDKKKDKAFFLKIAASLIFLIASGIVMWQWNAQRATDSSLLSEEKTRPEVKTESPEKRKSNPPSTIVAPKQQIKKAQKTVEKKKVESQKPVKEEFQAPLVGIDRSIAKIDEQTPVIEEEQHDADPVVETIPVEEQPVVAETTVEPTQDETKVKLVYSVAEVDEKYLDKKALAEATSAEKKPSTLRKLWDKASDLKNNQEAFGDLRQKKNEILALNFRSDKRSQNK